MRNDPAVAALQLRRTLRAKLRAGAQSVDVAAVDLNLLLDEVGRLQQGNDRLRRQNRRVRLRLHAAIGTDGEAGETDAEAPT